MIENTYTRRRDYFRAYARRPAVRAKKRAYLLTYRKRPEYWTRRKRLDNRPEALAKQRDRAKNYYWKHRSVILVRQRAYWRRPEVQARVKERRKRYYPEYAARNKDRINQQQRRYARKPEVLKRRRAYLDAYFKDPQKHGRRTLLKKLRRRNAGMEQRRQTRPEVSTGQLLSTHFPGDWKYTGQGDVTLGRCAPDFFNVNGKKATIEVYGCYHHACPTCGQPHSKHARPERDAKRLRMFEDMGHKTLVVWEHELKDPLAVVHAVQETFYL